MNEKIKLFASRIGSIGDHLWLDGRDPDEEEAVEKFAGFIIQECIQCIDNEISRLIEYQNSLDESEVSKRNDVDLCVEKCYDNIEMLKIHFGVE